MAWLAAFFLVAFYAIVAVGLGNVTDLYEPVPHWNPLDWNVGYILQAIEDVLPGGRTWDVFLRTLLYVGLAIALSLAIGYPVAYYVSRHAHGHAKVVLLVLLVAPFWISYLMRMFAWTNLLDSGGYAAQVLNALLDRRALLRGRAARRRRLARRAADRGHPRARLRLRAVPDPAAVRGAGPDRPAHDRGRARPRRLARAGLPARRAADVEGRDAGRDRADRAADVRRLLHAGPDVRARPRRRCWATRSTTTCRAGRTRRSAPR